MLLLFGSAVVRVSYYFDMVHPTTRALLGFPFLGGLILWWAYLPDFFGLYGVSSQFMYIYIFCGLSASFCVPLGTFYPRLGCA